MCERHRTNLTNLWRSSGGHRAIETEIGQIGAMPFTHEHGGVQEAIESTEIGEVPDVAEREPGGGEQAIGSTDIAASTHVMESDHGGVQQNQNPLTKVLVEAECQDFSMWSFLRAAGLVCGCWGR